ncbi:hypothetical protein D3C76_1394580 [compost metagenome]
MEAAFSMDVEVSVLIPSTLRRVCSSGLVTSSTIPSGAAPGSIAVTLRNGTLMFGMVSCFIVSPLYKPAKEMIMVRIQIANLLFSEKLMIPFIRWSLLLSVLPVSICLTSQPG